MPRTSSEATDEDADEDKDEGTDEDTGEGSEELTCQRMARLRDLMITACNLMEPINYFYDHLACDVVFRRGSVSGDPGIDSILHAIVAFMYGPAEALGKRRFQCYGPLWHGRFAFAFGEATVLYHGALDVGIVDMQASGARMFLRFNIGCWKMWPPGERPSS